MKSFFATVAIALASSAAFADDPPANYTLKFDANLRPYSPDHDFKNDNPTEGDVLNVVFDPTETFQTINSASGSLAVAKVLPELTYIEILSDSPVFIHRARSSESCIDTEHLPQGGTVTKLDEPCTLLATSQFSFPSTGSNMNAYRCSAGPIAQANQAPLTVKAVTDDGTMIMILSKFAPPNNAASEECLTTIASKDVSTAMDANPSLVIQFNGVLSQTPPMNRQADGTYTASVLVKAGHYSLSMRVSRAGALMGANSQDINVYSKDAHSLVRIQAELMASDRARKLDFAVAISPVTRNFFRSGPSLQCIPLCAITPILVARLSSTSSSTTSTLALGGGVGIFVNRAFQFNGGLLVGTSDLRSGWRIQRSWFVGAALDPFLVAEMLTTTSAPATSTTPPAGSTIQGVQ